MKRYWLVGLAFAALSLLVYTNWSEIETALRLLREVRWQYLLLVPLTLSISFLGRARYYQAFAKALGYNVKFGKMLRLAYGANFVNQISPSAGVTGVTYLSLSLRNKIPAGKTTLIEYSRYIITHLSFTPILLLGLGFIYFSGSIDKIVVRIVVLVIGMALLAAVVLLFAMSRRRQADKIVHRVVGLINRIGSGLRLKRKPLIAAEQVTRLLGDFHEGVDFILSNWPRLRGAFLAAILVNLMEVSSLYISFLALGHAVNPGAVIISYAVASIAGAISIIPGDVGVFEFALVTAFTGTGVPVAVALSATLLYRILNKVLSLLPGFYFYSSSISHLPKKDAPRLTPKSQG